MTGGSRETLTKARLNVAMTTGRLLVVEDDENLRSMLCAALRYNDFEVTACEDGRDALRLVAERHLDLILLDVMIPGIDGFEVCRQLRARGDRTPIVFLTARDTTQDKVQGLTIGGDDYVEKPFSIDELVARILAVRRRMQTAAGPGIIELADLSFDEDARIVVRDGEHIHLSPTEFKLLRYLLLNQGRVVSKGQILDHVWEFDYDGDGRVVETYIGYLRRKVDASEPKLIHTIRGAGYTMRLPL